MIFRIVIIKRKACWCYFI